MQPQVTVMTVPVNENHNYYTPAGRAATKRMAITQLVLGSLCVLFGIVLMALSWRWYRPFPDGIGSGIWNGLVFLVTGIVGINAATKNNACTVTAFLVMNIICTSIFSLTLLSMNSWAIVINSYRRCYSMYYRYSYGACSSGNPQTSLALNSLMLVMCVIEFVITIVCAAYCCGALCCRTRTNNAIIQHQAAQPYVQVPRAQATVVYPPGAVQYPMQAQSAQYVYPAAGYAVQPVGAPQYQPVGTQQCQPAPPGGSYPQQQAPTVQQQQTYPPQEEKPPARQPAAN